MTNANKSHLLLSALALVTLGSTSSLYAQVDKDLMKVVEEGPYVETAKTGISLSGYVDAGYTYNFIGNNETIQNRAFTNESRAKGDFDLNQLKLTLEKPLSDANELQAGFRADIVMGEDAGNFGTNGAPTTSDSIYLQQAYVDMRLPYGNGIELIAGKFGALIGYEAEERVENINITVGNVAAIDPAWYTGAGAFYAFNDTVDIGFAIGNGNGLDNGIGNDAADDEYAVTGFININAPGGNANLQTGFHIAPNGDGGYNTENEPVYVWNLFGNWAPVFAEDKLLLAFNTSIAAADQFNVAGRGADFYGLALYSKYLLTDIVSIAGRAEYMHTNNELFTGWAAGTKATDVWGLTGTLGFDLAQDLLVRLEYRVDWGSDLIMHNTAGTFSDGPAHTVATEVVFSF